MSKKAIIVENLAWLYADVIQGVMMGGLEDLTRVHGNTAQQPRNIYSPISDGGQAHQLQLESSSNSICTAISSKVSQISRKQASNLD